MSPIGTSRTLRDVRLESGMRTKRVDAQASGGFTPQDALKIKFDPERSGLDLERTLARKRPAVPIQKEQP